MISDLLQLKSFGSWVILGLLLILFVLVIVSQSLIIAARRSKMDESDFDQEDGD